MLLHIWPDIVWTRGACYLVSLSLDHVYPSGGLSFHKMNLVEPVHVSDNSLCPSAFQYSSILFSNNTSSDVCISLVTSMCFKGIRNDSSFGMLWVPRDGGK